MTDPSRDMLVKQPFDEQIKFFKRKVNIGTEHWDDILGKAHDHGFMVAGAMKAELLQDLREAVGKAIADGKSLQWFRGQFDEIVKRHGWAYQGERDWRTRVIYTTNLSTSYAAGRWQQLNDPDLLKAAPYWMYRHSDGVLYPRPLHVSWDKLTLPAQHPWFHTHYPPNGWGCKCYVIAVSAARAERLGARIADGPPDDGSWERVDRWGEVQELPKGIDYGWAHAPRRTWYPDLDKYPPEIGRQLIQENLRNGVFQRWHDRIEKQVTIMRALPENAGLSKTDLTIEARKLSTGEEFPVAILDAEWMRMLRVETQTVRLSDWDIFKQVISRDNQNFGALEYLSVQDVFDHAQLVVREDEQTTLFVHDGRRWYVAVLHQTETGRGLFLKSLRFSSKNDVRTQRKKGLVLRDTVNE